jgi:hypothetical protein
LSIVEYIMCIAVYVMSTLGVGMDVTASILYTDVYILYKYAKYVTYDHHADYHVQHVQQVPQLVNPFTMLHS